VDPLPYCTVSSPEVWDYSSPPISTSRQPENPQSLDSDSYPCAAPDSNQPGFISCANAFEQSCSNTTSVPASLPQFGSQCVQASGVNIVSTNQVCQFSPTSSSIHSGPRVVVSLPFKVKFLPPLIKICVGCRKGFLEVQMVKVACHPLKICV